MAKSKNDGDTASQTAERLPLGTFVIKGKQKKRKRKSDFTLKKVTSGHAAGSGWVTRKICVLMRQRVKEMEIDKKRCEHSRWLGSNCGSIRTFTINSRTFTMLFTEEMIVFYASAPPMWCDKITTGTVISKLIFILSRSMCIVWPEQVFENLRRDRPEVMDKVIPVAGDVTMPSLGISPQDLQVLCDEVSIVFNSAATVRFDEDLRTAVELNVKGPQRLMNVCHQMKRLEVTRRLICIAFTIFCRIDIFTYFLFFYLGSYPCLHCVQQFG